jgi:hypothetical protein
MDTTQNKLLGKPSSRVPMVSEDEVNPFHFVQHPNLLPKKRDHKIPDHRVFNTFQRGVRFDMLFLRNVVILGNFAVIVLELSKRDIQQALISCIDSIGVSILLACIQCWLYYEPRWNEQRLPKKMKDNKWNYMFKVKRPPQDIIKTGAEAGKMMGDWAKYLPLYKVNEVFLDIKLEELLNIFGRRQCKSCVEFDTGVKHESDDRVVRSWPLSPREEALIG